MFIHVVRPGENLFAIARLYGIRPEEIERINQLPNPERLLIGQAILIPVAIRTHTVAAGESLYAIARRYGVTVQALARANNLAPSAILSPGTVLTIPPRVRRPVDVNAYLETMGETGARLTRDVGFFLTYLSLFSYRVNAAGDLSTLNAGPPVEAALAAGVAPIMTITNFEDGTFSSEIARAVLSSLEVQNRLFDNIERILRAQRYRGINVDFEYLFPADRELYNRFLRRLVARFRPQGYLLSTALAPKTSPTQAGTLYEAHDYPVHGQLMDFVVLMTYEWGWSGGPPLPVAPIPQVRAVLDYAVTVIPSTKIMLGAPLYGYDWTLPYVPRGQWAQSIDPQEAIRRAVQYNTVIQYDSTAQAPFFRYTDANGRQHIVWFEDARSAQAKFDLIRAYNLRGISYWRLGNNFPQNWPLLFDNFVIRKI
ncbi:LysM peptidoglycan-binding domain-containing protein [Heliobacterium undosum]|uniref:LysM peptidoglycan-binding domain-containing protein n=1 Tax=Heliomicrobium undosum TaxID=121734 RepID=A0A845L5U8_9FIRM|nr:LysM peptidoglycan-binding domain-containing protein [Heliomicrobium undosum]MZP30425.1 LysM peptidoglycan-binding domain-containing protein [Heliomicrobium undosum]